MTSVKDFKGKEVAYILTRRQGQPQENFVSKCKIITAGKKYVTVIGGEKIASMIKFCKKHECENFLSESNPYIYPGRKLFLTSQEAMEEIERTRLKDWISYKLTSWEKDTYTLAQLRKIKAILEGESNT